MGAVVRWMAASLGPHVRLLFGLVVYRGDFFRHSRCGRSSRANNDNALSVLSALALNSVIAIAAIVVGGAAAILSAGIHRPTPGLHVTRDQR